MKLCVIYNTAPKYREAIFKEIDRTYDCDWYFGRTKSDIKEMNTSQLKSVQYYKSIGNPQILYWQGALLSTLFNKKYNDYLVLVEKRSISFYLFLLLKKIFFPKKRIYGWSHGWYGRESKLQKKIEKWKYKLLSDIFVYGNYAKNLMEMEGIPTKKIHVIHNSLDYNTQLKYRLQQKETDIFRDHFKNGFPTLIFIGRLTYVKKLNMILEALNLLKQQGERYNLVFVGDGQENDKLNDLTKKLNLQDNVWFYGACYDEKVNSELIYNADLCVSPGNIGLTVVHSLMFGTPALTHDNFTMQMPEFEAIMPTKTGLFFKYDSLESLVESISTWFKLNKDRESIRKDCFNEIDNNWNPKYQIELIKKYIK